METKKYIILESSIVPKQMNKYELLDLYFKESHKSIRYDTFSNILTGKETRRLKPAETLPQFCERRKIVFNPLYEPKVKKNI